MKFLTLVFLVALMLAATACASAAPDYRGVSYEEKISLFIGKQFTEVELAAGRPDDRFMTAAGTSICEYKYRYQCGYMGCVCVTRFMVGNNGTVEGTSYSGRCQ